MRKWKILAAALAVAYATPSYAQTQEEFSRELEGLKARMAAYESENAALRAQVSGQDDAALEQQINALKERALANTAVKSGANSVTLSGEFRFRSSWSLGDLLNSQEHDGTWNDAMVRLGFQYDFTRDVTAYAELQSHWAFGDGATTDFGESNTNVVLHQGWLEVRNIFNRPEFSSRTGRQEIVLGNQFQFGNADWYNGWAFDGTRWDWDSESFSLSAIFARLDSIDRDINQFPSALNPHDDDELYSLYFTLKTIKNHQLDLYWIYINGHGGAGGSGSGISIGALGTNQVGTQGGFGSTAYYHTVGARIGGVLPDVAAGLDWNVEFAYQFGDQQFAGGELDIDAFALEAELGLTFSKDSMFRIYARFLWAEGPNDNDELGYIPLYPNRHSNGGFRARYGIADLIPMTNVVTVQLGLHFDPDPAWTLGITGLWATTDESSSGAGNGFTQAATGNNILPGNGVPDEDYGWEIDVWGEYRYSDHLVFNAGVAFVFADDAAEALYGIDDDLQFYGYIQARLLF